jgi:hypothetical protein
VDLDFWDYTYQALGSETPRNPAVDSDILLEEVNERLYFLRNFASVSENGGRRISGKLLSFWKRLQRLVINSCRNQDMRMLED